MAAPLERAGACLPIAYFGRSDANASRSFPRGSKIVAGVDDRADPLFAIPTYTLAEMSEQVGELLNAFDGLAGFGRQFPLAVSRAARSRARQLHER